MAGLRPAQEPRRPKSFSSCSKQTEISYASLFTAHPARYSGDVAEHVFVIFKNIVNNRCDVKKLV
jgi:hypothetical protein